MAHDRSSAGRRSLLLVGCLTLGALAAACGSDSDDGAATTTTDASEAACADAQALDTSVESLKDVDVRAEGTNGVNAALDAVKDDLAALEESVSDALKPGVNAIQDAVDELETAAESIDTEGVAPTATAVANVATTTRTLLDTIESSEC